MIPLIGSIIYVDSKLERDGWEGVSTDNNPLDDSPTCPGAGLVSLAKCKAQV